jgi:RimJ/RimL family protein N-acetyltransferase
MNPFPTLETKRLLLRQLELSDAPIVQALLDDPEIVGNMLDKTTLNDAETMIRQSHSAYEAGTSIAFAIARKSNHDLVGYCDLEINAKHQRGKIAYWIGRPFWWQGYATEATKCLVRYGFDGLALNRIFAYVLTENTVSAKILRKAGLQWEGTQRQAVHKDSHFKDVDFYGLLRADFRAEEL